MTFSTVPVLISNFVGLPLRDSVTVQWVFLDLCLASVIPPKNALSSLGLYLPHLGCPAQNLEVPMLGTLFFNAIWHLDQGSASCRSWESDFPHLPQVQVGPSLSNHCINSLHFWIAPMWVSGFLAPMYVLGI